MPRPKKPQAAVGALVNDVEVAKVTGASRDMVAIDGVAANVAVSHMDTAEMIGAFKTVGYIASNLDSVQVRIFMQIRDEKRYVGVPYHDEHGQVRATATLEEFCARKLPVSYDTMRERVKQYELLGDAGFDGAMRLGLTFKQFRAIEGGDAEARKKIAAALERGSRTEVLDLVEELIEERREARRESLEKDKAIEAKDRVIDQKNKKLDQITEAEHKVPAWQRTFDKTVKSISERADALMRACADLARQAEELHDLDFEGVEKRAEQLALRAQLANRYYDLSEHLLEQSVGLFVAARGEYIEPLLDLARKQLPDDVKAKIFGADK